MSKLTTNTTNLQSILETINNLPEAGTDLPELTSPATADEVFLNKEAIDAEGNILTGTFTIDTEITTLNTLLPQLQETVDGLPEAGSSQVISVSVNFEAPTDGTEELYYVSTDGLQTISLMDYEPISFTFQCLANSILASNTSRYTISDGITSLTPDTFYVTSDCSLTYVG